MSWVTVKEPLEMCLEAIQSRADDEKWKGNRVVKSEAIQLPHQHTRVRDLSAFNDLNSHDNDH